MFLLKKIIIMRKIPRQRVDSVYYYYYYWHWFKLHRERVCSHYFSQKKKGKNTHTQRTGKNILKKSTAFLETDSTRCRRKIARRFSSSLKCKSVNARTREEFIADKIIGAPCPRRWSDKRVFTRIHCVYWIFKTWTRAKASVWRDWSSSINGS